MKLIRKYDTVFAGALSGIILPLITALVMFIFAKGNPSLGSWLERINNAGITTHVITLSAFSNIVIFLVFNYFDMLRAARGVLGATIVWAILVFGIKFLL
jgi:hypothetical protein